MTLRYDIQTMPMPMRGIFHAEREKKKRSRFWLANKSLTLRYKILTTVLMMQIRISWVESSTRREKKKSQSWASK
jgi:hypothetical protein